MQDVKKKCGIYPSSALTSWLYGAMVDVGFDVVDVDGIVGDTGRSGGYRMRVNGCNTDGKKRTLEGHGHRERTSSSWCKAFNEEMSKLQYCWWSSDTHSAWHVE